MRIVIPGRPVPKARPRVTIRGRQVIVYTPEETLSYQDWVGLCAREQAKYRFRGPVSVKATFYISGKQGDLDNLVKSLFDGLNGVVWEDDSQVKQLYAERVRCKRNEERVEVEIEEVQGHECVQPGTV